MEDAEYVEKLLSAVDRIEDTPIADRILRDSGQVRRDRFVTQVRDVGCQPFGLLKQALREDSVQWRQIGDDVRCERQAIPRHGTLPAQSEFVGHLIAGDACFRGERVL